jgi:hypothetical protein
VSETGNTSHIVLINDNINKVPRDLSEVGPDQKQYRSSIQLYGRVENTEDNITIIGDDPSFTAKVTVIRYTITPGVNEDWALIKPGDGIQCVEANEPVTTTPIPPATGGTTPNPYRWLGDTVVVSNRVVGNIGRITISSPNWVLGGPTAPIQYTHFIITRAENRQYFPTRKADTVISIATANEFNFLDNSEDNLSGTAGLNFYQLQTKPLIGRVSTVNKIGVVAADMIPFLSVYETRATESLLELFWETATTGLISDLNTDVLTGFEGPAGFDNVDYKHFEWQDPEGDGLGTGNQDSKYITDSFFVVDQTGYPILDTTVDLIDVRDGNGDSRLLEFGLEPVPASSPKQYRLYIKPFGPPPLTGTPFVFNNNAEVKESYIFTFSVTDNSDENEPLPTTLTISNRLSNNAPIITTTDVNYSITQNTTTFATLEAVNGSFSLSESDLKWSIIGGDTPVPSFSISPYTGVLSLINDEIPLGTYYLEIKVEDAVNTNTGQLLLPTGDLGTLEDTIILNINVGDAPVPYWLRPDYESQAIQTIALCGTNSDNGTGIAYIGKNANPTNSYFSTIPGFSGTTYDVIENIEVENAEEWIPGDTIQPTGLVQGEYRVSVKLDVFAPGFCTQTQSSISGTAFIYLYKRIWNPASPGSWELINNENNFGILPTYKIGPLTGFSIDDQGNFITSTPQSLTTTFTIEAEENEHEYAVVVLVSSFFSHASGLGPYVKIFGNDANYSYNQAYPFEPPSNPPVTTAYEYYTGVEEITADPMIPGYTSGIPYTTPDATRGLDYNSPTNTIASGTAFSGVELVTLTLSSVNNQIAPGLLCGLEAGPSVGLPFPGKIVNVNPANPAEITLQLIYGWPNLTQDLANGNLRVYSTFDPLLPIGKLYANTEEGTEVRRLYTDSGFTQKWIPPVPNRYYNFITTKNYDPEATNVYTAFPFYCALVNEEGEIQLQTGTDFNVQTAWIGQNPQNTGPISIANYGYNVLYKQTL